MTFQYNDGGRKAAGYQGHAGDCVARSIAIITGKPYTEVYDRLAEGTATQRKSKHYGKKTRSARSGVHVTRKWFKEYMRELGYEWIPTMFVGQGCKVHLSADELPTGRLIIAVSNHYTAMINGVIHDTHDPRREDSWIIEPGGKATKVGGRCVYGYWKDIWA